MTRGRDLPFAMILCIGALSFSGCQADQGDNTVPPAAESEATTGSETDSATESRAASHSYSLNETGDGLVSREGLEIPILDGAVNGSVDHGIDSGGVAEVAGWAAHVESSTPADAIVVVKNGEVVVSSAPNLERPDVAEHFGDSGLSTSGFQLEFPADDEMEVRIFAVVGERGSELPYTEGFQWGSGDSD